MHKLFKAKYLIMIVLARAPLLLSFLSPLKVEGPKD